MTAMTEYVPTGLRTLTPLLVARDAAAAIELYKDVFGALEVDRTTDGAGGVVMPLCASPIRSSRWAKQSDVASSTPSGFRR